MRHFHGSIHSIEKTKFCDYCMGLLIHEKLLKSSMPQAFSKAKDDFEVISQFKLFRVKIFRKSYITVCI